MNDYFLNQYEEINHRLESIVQRAGRIHSNDTFTKSVNCVATDRTCHGQLPTAPSHKVDKFPIRPVNDRISGLFKESSSPSVTTKRQLSYEVMGLGVSTRKAQLNSRCLDTGKKQRVKRERVIAGVSVRERVELLNRNSAVRNNPEILSKDNDIKEVATKEEPTVLASNVAHAPPVITQRKLVPSFEDQQERNGTLMKTKDLRVSQLFAGHWNFVNTVTIVTRYLMDKISSLYHF